MSEAPLCTSCMMVWSTRHHANRPWNLGSGLALEKVWSMSGPQRSWSLRVVHSGQSTCHAMSGRGDWSGTHEGESGPLRVVHFSRHKWPGGYMLSSQTSSRRSKAVREVKP